MGDVASPQEARRVQAVRQAVAGPPLPQDRAKVSVVETVTSHREDGRRLHTHFRIFIVVFFAECSLLFFCYTFSVP